MKELHISLGQRSYAIRVEDGLLDRCGEEVRAVCPGARLAFVVSDETVAPLYLARVERSLEQVGLIPACAVIPAGERSKSVEKLAWLWEEMLSAGLTRTDCVIALGGGVVGDLAGFAAATVLRGVDLIQIPTTLLAQVDSSVGGKVAIDLPAGKNLAGAFWQPKRVLVDPQTLETLPDAVFADGMAEVIKYGCIARPELLHLLETCPSRAGVMEHIEQVIVTCCDCKRELVEADERDTGERMLLNFGHTVGHAYELAGDYVRCTHGQAVAAGMMTALRLGESLLGYDGALREELAGLLGAFSLPLSLPCPWEDAVAALSRDKKGSGDQLRLVLLPQLGRGEVVSLDREQVLTALKPLLEH